jgi:hypothetical protein
MPPRFRRRLPTVRVTYHITAVSNPRGLAMQSGSPHLSQKPQRSVIPQCTLFIVRRHISAYLSQLPERGINSATANSSSA